MYHRYHRMHRAVLAHRQRFLRSGPPLWEQCGNPLFPFYNTVFRSPEAPIETMADLRFLPHSLWDAAAYPFYWLIGIHRSSEGPFRDPRFAILFVLFVANAGAGLFHKLRVFTRRDKQFLLFFAVAYGMWLFTFSIHRYAIALELLTAPLIVRLLARLLGLLPYESLRASPLWTSVAAATAAVAIAFWSQPADCLRRPWSDPYQPILSGLLLNTATYLAIEKPVGYVVPLLSSGSRVYQLADILLPIAPRGVPGPPHSLRPRQSVAGGRLGTAASRQPAAAESARHVRLAVRPVAVV